MADTNPHSNVPHDPDSGDYDPNEVVQPIETITICYGMFADGDVGVWTNIDEVSSPTLALGMVEQAKQVLFYEMASVNTDTFGILGDDDEGDTLTDPDDDLDDDE